MAKKFCIEWSYICHKTKLWLFCMNFVAISWFQIKLWYTYIYSVMLEFKLYILYRYCNKNIYLVSLFQYQIHVQGNHNIKTGFFLSDLLCWGQIYLTIGWFISCQQIETPDTLSEDQLNDLLDQCARSLSRSTIMGTDSRVSHRDAESRDTQRSVNSSRASMPESDADSMYLPSEDTTPRYEYIKGLL